MNEVRSMRRYKFSLQNATLTKYTLHIQNVNTQNLGIKFSLQLLENIMIFCNKL